jgi:hypothetical protein
MATPLTVKVAAPATVAAAVEVPAGTVVAFAVATMPGMFAVVIAAACALASTATEPRAIAAPPPIFTLKACGVLLGTVPIDWLVRLKPW